MAEWLRSILSRDGELSRITCEFPGGEKAYYVIRCDRTNHLRLKNFLDRPLAAELDLASFGEIVESGWEGAANQD